MKNKSKIFERITSGIIAIVLALTTLTSGFSVIKPTQSALAADDSIDFGDEDKWYIYDHYDRQGQNGTNGLITSITADPGKKNFGGIDKPYYSWKESQDYSNNKYYTNISDIETDAYPKNAVAHFGNHMYVSGSGSNTKVSFLGYGVPAYADFMIHKKGADNGIKSVAFDIDFASIGTHTFDGAGILFNAKVTEGSTPVDSKLEGYLLYFKVTSGGAGTLHLIDLKDMGNVTLDSLHQGTVAVPQGKVLEKWTLGSDRKLRINLAIKPDKVSISRQISDSGNWGKRVTFDEGLANVYGNDFGPLTKYTSHGCSQFTHIAMENFSMSSGYTAAFDLNDGQAGTPKAKWNASNIPDQLVSNIKPGETLGQINKWPDAEPTRDGYYFMGWSTQPTGDDKTPFTKDTPINDITRVYAVWVKEHGLLNYYSDGKGQILDKTGSKHDKIEKDPFEIEKNPFKQFPKFEVKDNTLTFLGWKDQDGGIWLADENGNILPNSPNKTLTVEKDKSYSFTAIVEKDENGDGIPDKDQAMYNVTFETDTNNGTMSGNSDYLIAGPDGSKAGDSLDPKNSFVTIKGTPGTKVSFGAPTVTAKNSGKPFLYWTDGKDIYKKEDIDKMLFTSDKKFTAVFGVDENEDGIIDKEQALYKVNFDTEDATKGKITTGTQNYWVAGKEGTKQGQELNVKDTTNVKVTAVGSTSVSVLTTPEVKAEKGYVFSGLWTDGKVKYTKAQVESLKLKDNITLKAVFEEDENGDGIIDNEQSLYSVKFIIDPAKGNTTNVTEFWVAGPKGSQNKVLDVTDSTVKVTQKSDGKEVSLVAPKVTTTGDPFLGNWKGDSGNFTEAQIATLKIGKNMEFTAIFSKDENGDGIADDEQALYVVDFEVADPADGAVKPGAVTKYYVAGVKGTKQGQSLDVSKADIRDFNNTGTTVKFESPEVVSNAPKAFTDKWTDGVNIFMNSQLSNISVNGNKTFTAMFDGDENKDGIPDSQQALYTVNFEVSSEDASKGSINASETVKYYVAGPKGSVQGQNLSVTSATVTPTGYKIPAVTVTGDNMLLDTWTDGSKQYTNNQILNLNINKSINLKAMFDEDKNGDGIPDSQQALYSVKFEIDSEDIGDLVFASGVQEFWIAGEKGTKQGQIINVNDATVKVTDKNASGFAPVTFKSPIVATTSNKKFNNNWTNGDTYYTTLALLDLKINKDMTISPIAVENVEVTFKGWNGEYRDNQNNTIKVDTGNTVNSAVGMNNVVAHNNIKRPGYTVTGWKIEGGDSTVYTNAQVGAMIVEESITFVAQYKKGR